MFEINPTYKTDSLTFERPASSASQVSRQPAVVNVKGTSTDKKITKKELDTAAGMRPSKAVDYLIDNSPLGWTKPTAQDLESMGYNQRVPHDWYHLSEYYDSPSGVIEDYNMTSENGSTQLVYKTNDGKYTQIMVYDKNGNLLKGEFISKDDFGNTLENLTVLVDEDGKKSYIQ